MSSGTFEDDLVHEWLAGVASNAYVSLHYESPALMGLNRGEISGGGYVRQRVLFTVPANRAMWSETNARFTGLMANRLTHFGIWNEKRLGRLEAYGLLPDGVIIAPGGAYVVPAGALALSLA